MSSPDYVRGLRVAYVNPRNSSSLCPKCGGKLKPDGHRLLKCPNCGLRADRDVIGAWNLAQRYVGSFRSPRKPGHESLATGQSREVPLGPAGQNGH